MAKTKEQKKEILNDYAENINISESVIFVRQSGIKVNVLNELRKQLFDNSVKVTTVKNTLVKRALKQSNIDLELGNGSFLTFFIPENTIEAVKIIKKSLADSKNLSGDKSLAEIECGIFEKVTLNSVQVQELADMPDKKTSISMILGIIDSSITSIMNVLEDPIRSYMSIIEQSKK